uniref:Ig-like domain-containing protein n=1 Tax=Callorhinchus milii TaxID=7868 RepID=A0A4W3GHZ2_CALMI
MFQRHYKSLYQIQRLLKLLLWHSTLLFVWFLGHCGGDAVTQLQSTVKVNEGEDVYLQCNYTATTTSDPDLYWYRHHPNKAPEYILWTDKSNNPRHADFATDRFITHVEEAERTVPLNLSQVRVADSAVYYYALSRTEAQISDAALQKLGPMHVYVSCVS